MSEMHMEIFKSAGGRQPWRFRMVGGNGEIVSSSEGYVTRWNARRQAKKIALLMGIELVDKTTKPYRKFP